MAPDRVYPDLEAPQTGPPFSPGAYQKLKDSQNAPPGAYYNQTAPPAYYNQQIPAPAMYQERRQGRSPCCTCLKWLCIIHLILFFLLGLFVLIFWLIVMPKAPQFDLQTVHITGLTETSSETTIDYEITAYNPNKKMDFYYSDISIKVEASGTVVGQGDISDFSQGHKNTNYLNGELTDKVTLSSDALNSITQNESNVALYAEVDLKVKVKVWSTKSGKIKAKVKCNINVDLTDTSGSQLKSSKCKYHW